jgi:hypothetical protein
MEMNEMKDVAKFLFKKKTTTHIDSKDGGFYNGLIMELHETFIVLLDRVLGEIPIAFSEIKLIEKFRR